MANRFILIHKRGSHADADINTYDEPFAWLSINDILIDPTFQFCPVDLIRAIVSCISVIILLIIYRLFYYNRAAILVSKTTD